MGIWKFRTTIAGVETADSLLIEFESAVSTFLLSPFSVILNMYKVKDAMVE